MLDSHHHFWRYNPAEYGWINDSMAALRRDFLPADLEREIAAVGITGVVSVQARQTLGETRWLLDLAERHDFIRGVVGWAPLVAADFKAQLAPLAGNKKLKAIRHVLQDEPDPNYMLRADFNAGVASLRQFGLVYDILIFERHLPQTIEFVDRHPNQTFVLDHIAKPRIRDNLLSPWRENIRELARRENVYCKISGMATESYWHGWTHTQLRPYFDTVVDAFGLRRMMFGSDWPVCLLASNYGGWLITVNTGLGPLSADECRSVFGQTATDVYSL